MTTGADGKPPLSGRPWILFLGAVATLIVLHLLPAIAELLLVLFGAVVFGVLLDGWVKWLLRWKLLNRTVAVLGTCLCIALLTSAVVWLGGSKLVDQFDQLSAQLSEAGEKVRDYLENSQWASSLVTGGDSNGIPGGHLLGTLGGVFRSVFGILGNGAILIIISIYLAIHAHLYTRGFLRLIPPPHRPRWGQALQTAAVAVRWWFVGRLCSMAAIGVLTGLGLWIAGVPMPLPLGFIAGLLSFVPYIGSIGGALPGILVAWAQGPSTALYATGVYLAVQALEGNLITPLIDRRSVSMPPALLIASQLALGVLFGIWGVIWAAPLTLVAMIIVQMFYIRNVLNEEQKVIGEKDGKAEPEF